MQNAELRYGLRSFFMAARSDAQQTIAPVILCSDEVKECIALFMGKTPEQMVRMFELWAVHGNDGRPFIAAAYWSNVSRCAWSCKAQEREHVEARVPPLHPDETEYVTAALRCVG